MSLPEMMTVEEAAAAIHEKVKQSTVRRAIREGRLDAKKLFGRYCVTPEALERFVKCPEKRSRPDSGSAETTRGSSSSEAVSTGQAMAMKSASRLKNISRGGSRAARPAASVQPIRPK